MKKTIIIAVVVGVVAGIGGRMALAGDGRPAERERRRRRRRPSTWCRPTAPSRARGPRSRCGRKSRAP